MIRGDWLSHGLKSGVAPRGAEGLVHLLESGQGVPVQGPRHEGHEQSAVRLLLHQADPTLIEWLDCKAVLAVEDARQQRPESSVMHGP